MSALNRFSRPARCLMPLLLATAGAAWANPWTTVGSAGVVDESDTGIVEFVNGEARMRSDAPAGSVLNLRYNIVSLEGFTGYNQVSWASRFRDNGSGARVRLYLRQYNLKTGTTSTLDTYDSDAYASSPNYQWQVRCTAADWDFQNGPFYIEAELTKSTSSGAPALGIVMLTNGSCVP